VADRYVSVPITLSDLERQDTRVKFFRWISFITLVPLDDQFRQDNIRGDRHISKSHRRPYRRGCMGSRRSTILEGSFLFMRTPFVAELPNNTIWRDVFVLKWSARLPHSTLKGGVPALPNFGVPFYVRIHLLTQNYQISHGNMYGDGFCFYMISHALTSLGLVPAQPSFGGSLLLMRTSFVAELSNLTL